MFRSGIVCGAFPGGTSRQQRRRLAVHARLSAASSHLLFQPELSEETPSGSMGVGIESMARQVRIQIKPRFHCFAFMKTSRVVSCRGSKFTSSARIQTDAHKIYRQRINVTVVHPEGER